MNDDLQVDSATALAAALRLPRPMAFTSGVFDLLHAGHLRLFNQARQLASSLVVGVASDATARLSAGAGRPLMAQHDRVALVGALAPVSIALLFHERDATALIDALRPELYLKGSDETLDECPEAQRVLRWGGRALLLPRLPGRSTRVLLARVRDGAGPSWPRAA